MVNTQNRIPPAIEHYLRLPTETSQILISSTLGCSATWLLSRFALGALHGDGDGRDGDEPAVVFASWMRDSAFWKTEFRRSVGLDIAKLTDEGRFAFVDLLSAQPSSETSFLADAESRIAHAIARLQASAKRQILLVMDGLDVTLALAFAKAHELNRMILRLRSTVRAVVIACSADAPMVGAATQAHDTRLPPMEVETAAFLVQSAHASAFVMSLRSLDTGAAKDVSGVLRVTRGSGSYDLDDGGGDELKDVELLYLVQRDGSVKVFERGEGAE